MYNAIKNTATGLAKGVLWGILVVIDTTINIPKAIGAFLCRLAYSMRGGVCPDWLDPIWSKKSRRFREGKKVWGGSNKYGTATATEFFLQGGSRRKFSKHRRKSKRRKSSRKSKRRKSKKKSKKRRKKSRRSKK